MWADTRSHIISRLTPTQFSFPSPPHEQFILSIKQIQQYISDSYLKALLGSINKTTPWPNFSEETFTKSNTSCLSLSKNQVSEPGQKGQVSLLDPGVSCICLGLLSRVLSTTADHQIFGHSEVHTGFSISHSGKSLVLLTLRPWHAFQRLKLHHFYTNKIQRFLSGGE